MSVTDLLTAGIGGLVGGSVSALLTWLWTHKKWDKTAHSFKTAARLIAEGLPLQGIEPKFDEDNWLVGLTYKEHIVESVAAGDSAAAREGNEEEEREEGNGDTA